ncbi:MAG: cellobiose phosphorylase [Anaerolineales bacterium]
MEPFYFDRQQRFVIEDFANRQPFASFLPGIAGPLGVPLWVFYTNRGQAIAGFGVEDRDNPIMEFQPANKAYQTTPLTGFRTFIKLLGEAPVLYEPFAPWEAATRSRMAIGMNELELQTESAVHGVQTTVTYFTLSGEPFAGLARRLQVTNVSDGPLNLEILDGLPWVQPYGVDEQGLKMMGRTLEAWKGVFNVTPTKEGLSGVPFYHFQASAGDTAEVAAVQAGHFYLAFCEEEEVPLLPLVDPDVVFDSDTSLHTPLGFVKQPLAELQACRQITTGKTPCGFFGTARTLTPGESVTLQAIIGHVGTVAHLHQHQTRIARTAYLEDQRERATELAHEITNVVETQTAEPRFDAYCRQTFLDNVLRGGWPLLLGPEDHPFVYHVYSRKHGDMERDYNAFYLAAEPYSQGNGNYRDVAQNRRSDVFFEPQIDDFNVLSFLSLIQADGYNPLVVRGVRFTLAPEHHTRLLALVEHPEPLAAALAQPFTPGGLLRVILDRQLGLTVAPTDFVTAALDHADAHFEAEFGEGYWIDHWFYNLDLIDSYLAIYPERKRTLLFERRVPYFASPAAVQPRARQYVLTERGVRRYHALHEDEESADNGPAAWVHTEEGEIYRATVFEKLCALALLKFATLDPWGMGIEMEAGRPGWYDALNGLPGLIGSSLCESYELLRLLDFLLAVLSEMPALTLVLPVEQGALLETVRRALATWTAANDADRDFVYWDTVATAREGYRAQIRRGFEGATVVLDAETLDAALHAFRTRVDAGLERAVELNEGTPPTYIAYTVTKYETLPERDEQDRPYVRPLQFSPHLLPLFLEGPVHALKVAPDAARAREIHARVRESPLYDRQLGMYKVNAPLAGESHELGRCRAFTPGWLENESIWLHMEYKYLLELLKAGLHDAFFADFEEVLVPFLDPARYGRSPLENSSFIVSSAHPDASLHGRGFVARLSGSTAEFLSIWHTMMAGQQPFQVREGELCLVLQPVLPGRLFRSDGTLTFTFLGHCTVTYHNPAREDTFRPEMEISRVEFELDGKRIILDGSVIGAPYAGMVRSGEVSSIDVVLKSEGVRAT